MVKVGLIRCQSAMRICPGTSCFRAIREIAGCFAPYYDKGIEIIGRSPCGGCPGRDTVRQAAEMVQRGAEVMFLSTCVVKTLPPAPKCAYSEDIAEATRKKIDFKVAMETH